MPSKRPRRTLLSASLTALMAVGLLLTPASAQPNELPNTIVLIAHPSVGTANVSRDTARAMFAMRQRTWPNGQAAQVYVLPNRDPVHGRFSKEQLGVYPHQLQLAWDRMVFSGMGQAPNRARDQADMRQQVASTPGALGYLEREYLDESVRVISME
ncbi:hypothetical protein ACXGSL_11970 [Vreelandella aquamarina]|nr:MULTISPECIES: hypothetical protein [Halomonas]KJD20214.1 hypothetical protein VE30_03415 [Halomonas meridiana]BBI72974.2 hypothetical protein HAALTHF_25870n [Halomonas axialensis]